MERAKFFLKGRFSIFAHLEEDQRFVAGFDLFFPAIDRFDTGKNVCAGRKFFGDAKSTTPI